jgi:hypothetical protein
VLGNVSGPADAYIVLRFGEMSRHPFDYVLREYKASRGKGWGVLAERLGIKPGSEFHALKRGHDLYNGNEGKGKGKGRRLTAQVDDCGGRTSKGRTRAPCQSLLLLAEDLRLIVPATSSSTTGTTCRSSRSAHWALSSAIAASILDQVK